jgi:shikimate kinase / 3-dehydroquinate synthase
MIPSPVFPLLLNGFMGTGKSTVARLCAAELGAEAVDLDERIVLRTGKSIADLFAEQGEAAFRALEQEELRRLEAEFRGRKWVVALGGGALLDRSARLHWLYRSTIVTLRASAREILARVSAQDGATGARPLLRAPDPLARIEQLLLERAPAYAECHGEVSTEGKEPALIAKDVVSIFRRSPVPVASGLESYRVEIGSGILEGFVGPEARGASGALLVSDKTVFPLYGQGVLEALREVSLSPGHTLLTPGEEFKNLASLESIYRQAYELSLDRKAVFVGLGGGVVTDMTGFAAATWVRGVRWLGAPTTLLSMVDASVGGKTAVDFELAKNSVGAFWQPSGVVCDVRTLKTETDRAYRGALSEVIKTALIGDPGLFELLEKEPRAILARDPALLEVIVRASVRVKAQVVALDPRESGIRAHLNLGHTIGHALESAGGYSKLTHGEAVSLGLVAALRLGTQLGRTPEELTRRVERLLGTLGLPRELSRGDLTEAATLVGRDKKRAGKNVTFVFARAVGDVFREPVALSELERLSPGLADPGLA